LGNLFSTPLDSGNDSLLKIFFAKTKARARDAKRTYKLSRVVEHGSSSTSNLFLVLLVVDCPAPLLDLL